MMQRMFGGFSAAGTAAANSKAYIPPTMFVLAV
jgi:hypothetical protein